MAGRTAPIGRPGRGTLGSKPAARPSQAKARPSRPAPTAQSLTAPVRAAAEAPVARVPGGIRLTTRLMAVLAVLAILLLSYATSLRVYFNQQRELAATKLEIQQRQDAIADMREEVQRWQDPAYVKAQARERLGWVVPGEIGFKVVGADGEALGGGASITKDGALPEGERGKLWYELLWESVQAADNPAPSEP